jgi:hypothetical protein
VSEAYLEALREEISAWEELEATLRVQRQAIIGRDSAGVWECQERLREGLREVIVACQNTARQKTPLTDGPAQETERGAQGLRLQVRNSIRLNNDLLRDICTYLEMIREVAFPHTLPPTYSHPRVVRSLPHSTNSPLTGSKVA